MKKNVVKLVTDNKGPRFDSAIERNEFLWMARTPMDPWKAQGLKGNLLANQVFARMKK
jgi:hypothetical protein